MAVSKFGTRKISTLATIFEESRRIPTFFEKSGYNLRSLASSITTTSTRAIRKARAYGCTTIFWWMTTCAAYCVCSWHKHGHTRLRKLGVHLQLQDERERGNKGKRQEYRREHVLRMRAQKPYKSGHEYEWNHTIEYTTLLKRPDHSLSCE